MAVPFLHNIDLNENQLLNAKVHTDTTAPSNPGTGTLWFDTNTNVNLLKIYRGGSWGNVYVNTEAPAVGVTHPSSGGQIVSFVSSGTVTLTNKTIDADSNTISNIEVDNFKASAIVIESEGIGSNDNDTTIPTSAAVIDYVASQITLEDLDFSGDSGTGSVDLNSQTFAITGDTGITTTASNQGLSIDLDDTLTVAEAGSYGSSTSIPTFTVNQQGQLTAVGSASVSTTLDIAADSGDDDGVRLGTDTLTISGTTNEIETSVSGDTITVGLPDNVTVGGNLIVSGNLTINGTTTDVDTTNLVVEDPLIKLAKNNTSSDSLDIGFYGLYEDGGTDKYAGLFRDASDSGKFKLFHLTQTEPTTTVNTNATGWNVATLVANIEGNVTGNLTGQADRVSTNLTVDDTTIQFDSGTTYNGSTARTISAKTAAIADGGTGLATADQIYDHVTSRLSTEHAAKNKSFELDDNVSGVESSDNITYTITHGMGASRLYKVEVIEDSGNYETVYVEVQRPSDTTIKIIFGSAVTAGAYRALITKI